MCGNTKNKTIFKVAVLGVIASLFCVDCGDKNTDDGDGENTYSMITLDPGGGEVTPTSITATQLLNSDWVDVSLPRPTRNGYVFRGWYMAKDGHGNEVTTSVRCEPVGTRTVCGDITIYAHWAIAHYWITFEYV